MSKIRIAAVLVAGGAMLTLASGPAFAGEITGNGQKSLKQADGTLHGQSECAFSGQNDGYFDGSEPGVRVQSFGHDVVRTSAAEGSVDDLARAGWGTMFGVEGTHGAGVPGFACNPTSVQIPE